MARCSCATSSSPCPDGLRSKMRIQSFVLSGRLLMGAWLIASAAARAEADDWKFQVLLDGKPIGSHHFQISEEGTETRLLSEADFRVTVLAVPVYRYRHVSH